MSVKTCILTLSFVLASCHRKDWTHGRSKSLALVSSEFSKGPDGWTVAVIGSSEQLSEPAVERASLKVSDPGQTVWYFVAPSKFSGNLLLAYNGGLYFKVWHPKQPAPGTPPAKPSPRGPDVILDTNCGFELRLYNIIASPTITPQVYFVPLYEQASEWIDSRTNRRAQQLVFVEALSHVKSLRIRGGYFVGPETAQLGDVRITPPSLDEFGGRDLRPCCASDGAVVPCIVEGGKSVPGAFRYDASATPPDLLQFECGGSLFSASQRPKIHAIHPRVARKSGGTKITVFGENFGLDGTSALRIGGRESVDCQFYAAKHCTNGIIDFDEQNVDCGGENCAPCSYVVPHCVSGVLDVDEEKPDCGGASCVACSVVNVSAHCSNGIMDFDEEAVDMGGGDCLPPFCFDNRLSGDKTDVDNNCGGSCQPCNPIVVLNPVLVNGEYEMAICRAPPAETESAVEDGVSFIRRDAETEYTSCAYDNEATRGFAYGGFDADWFVHWASLETSVINDVNISNIGVETHSGDVYVTATVTKLQDSSTGRNGVMAKQLDKGGWYEPGFGGVGSEDEIILENEGDGNGFDADITYTALLKLDKYGKVAWLTYMESQYSMVATDILVDSMAATKSVVVVGYFKGYAPRFYQVNPQTRKARRGPNHDDGVFCTNPEEVQDVSNCFYFQAEAVFSNPLEPSSGSQQLTKVGVFLVSYTPDGVATAAQGEMYFAGTASYINTEGIRIAAHSLAPPAPGIENGTVGSGLEGSSGLYLVFHAVVSRYGDTLYVAEQAKGYQYLSDCKGGTVETRWPGAANETQVCVGGVQQQRDVLSVRFAARVPTPDNEQGFLVLSKFVVTGRRFGSVWARVIGEVGVGSATRVGGLGADRDGAYLAASFTAGIVGNLTFQTCPFNQRLPECEVGGAWYSEATAECILQPNYARAPNQVCAAVYVQTLAKHTVAPRLPQHSEALGSLLLAAYTGGGELRWHRRAMGGSLSARAMVAVPQSSGKAGLGEGMVYVAGQVGRVEDVDGNVLYSEFGEVRYPPRCASSCHGRVTGMSLDSADIFLAQYASADGELMWVRRLGQRDAEEIVESMTAMPARNSVILAGTFWGTGTSAEDVFGLVAAGRAQAAGCSVVEGPMWSSEAAAWEYNQANNEGLPDCRLRPLGQDLTAATGFIMEVAQGDGEVSVPGGRGMPYAACDGEGEEGCNAEGVVWAKTVAGAAGGLQGAPHSYGVAVRGWKGGLAIGGRFSGVVRGDRGGKGLTVAGVDEQGVYNNGETNSESLIIMLQE